MTGEIAKTQCEIDFKIRSLIVKVFNFTDKFLFILECLKFRADYFVII